MNEKMVLLSNGKNHFSFLEDEDVEEKKDLLHLTRFPQARHKPVFTVHMTVNPGLVCL